MAQCLSVCVCQQSVCPVRTSGWIELGFGLVASFALSCTVFQEIQVSCKKSTFLRNFIRKSLDLEKI